jgi:hypothetical protein
VLKPWKNWLTRWAFQRELLKTVERYNELARKGVDEDYGKRPTA